MDTIDTIMKSIVNLRVHIAPVGFEVDRIVIPAVSQKADKVWLIVHDNVSEDLAVKYREKVKQDLEKTGITGLISSGFIDYVVIGFALLPLSWFGMMRLVRGQVLSVVNSEYIESAKAMGVSRTRILIKHVFPNILGPIIVSATFGLGAVAGTEIILSFFGLGVQPPHPSLGIMISEVTGRGAASVSVLKNHPEQLLVPIIIVWLLIFCWNLLGDALTDVFNPRSK